MTKAIVLTGIIVGTYIASWIMGRYALRRSTRRHPANTRPQPHRSHTIRTAPPASGKTPQTQERKPCPPSHRS